MELICEDYYFYNNGVYKTISKLSPEGWFQDIKKVEPSIRIFGTREQVDEAFETYVELTGLNVDECYDYENEDKLKEYKERYDKLTNNKALITTI
jgi:hypothetical protein